MGNSKEALSFSLLGIKTRHDLDFPRSRSAPFPAAVEHNASPDSSASQRPSK